MIEHKFFSLRKYKDISEAARELDKLMMYEGFVVLCCVGKTNNTLLLRRILDDVQPANPAQPTPQMAQQPSTPAQKKNKRKSLRFPNAVHP